MSQNSVKLRFEIVRDGEVVRTEELDQNVIKIGKLASSHLRLEDPNVSRIHAVIEKGSGGSYSVIDLGSASGTFVNGEKVTKTEISGGDELQFGNTTVNVSFVEAGAQPAADMEFGGAADATQVTTGLEQRLDGDRQQSGARPSSQAESNAAQPAPSEPAAEQAQQQQATEASQQAATQQAATQQGAEHQPVQLADGTVVQPYTQQGYYDEQNNYIPYWYDEHGQYQAGYGYYDEAGSWQVAYGLSLIHI